MTISQADAIEGVLDAVRDKLEQSASNGELREVSSIVDGDSLGYTPETPVIWIMSADASVDHDRSLRETWTLPLVLVTIVQMNVEAAVHRRKAIRLTSIAQSLLVEDRNLCLDYVQDVQKSSLAFRSQRGPDREHGLYAAAGTVNVILNILEE